VKAAACEQREIRTLIVKFVEASEVQWQAYCIYQYVYTNMLMTVPISH
jgi:hypothetical protein